MLFRSITIDSVSLVNFGFSPDYQHAIEQKVIATQATLKAEQDLKRIQVEAQQAIATAEGRAKAIQIETQAINSQGGAAYVQLEAIKKWDQFNHFRVSVVMGDARQRVRALRKEADIYCINYDNLQWLVQALNGDWPFRTEIGRAHV